MLVQERSKENFFGGGGGGVKAVKNDENCGDCRHHIMQKVTTKHAMEGQKKVQ